MSNLPPGVTDNMIPGNTPEDGDIEAAIDAMFESGIEIRSWVGLIRKLSPVLSPLLQAEYRDGRFLVNGGVTGNGQGQTRFAHTGTPGDDNQVRALQSAHELIQPGKTG